jgi:hypothetical protein
MYSTVPESVEVRAFAAAMAPTTPSAKTWHGTVREALRLRRAIHRQVCRPRMETTDFLGVCQPGYTPLFTQQQLDRLVFVLRNVDHYTRQEFTK